MELSNTPISVFRRHLKHYMERIAAGEVFNVNGVVVGSREKVDKRGNLIDKYEA